MIGYSDLEQLYNDCVRWVNAFGNQCNLTELYKAYKEAENEMEKSIIDDLIWIKEFIECFSKKTKTQIEFEIEQPCFEKYISILKNRLEHLKKNIKKF